MGADKLVLTPVCGRPDGVSPALGAGFKLPEV